MIAVDPCLAVCHQIALSRVAVAIAVAVAVAVTIAYLYGTESSVVQRE